MLFDEGGDTFSKLCKVGLALMPSTMNMFEEEKYDFHSIRILSESHYII